MDTFLLYKWERVFSRFFDTNESWAIDWGDCYLVCRKVREIYGADSKQVSPCLSVRLSPSGIVSLLRWAWPRRS